MPRVRFIPEPVRYGERRPRWLTPTAARAVFSEREGQHVRMPSMCGIDPAYAWAYRASGKGPIFETVKVLKRVGPLFVYSNEKGGATLWFVVDSRSGLALGPTFDRMRDALALARGLGPRFDEFMTRAGRGDERAMTAIVRLCSIHRTRQFVRYAAKRPSRSDSSRA